MRSHLHARFKRDFATLPSDIQRRAKMAYRRFESDVDHPGLEFKRLNVKSNWWSVRINDNYRAVGVRDGDLIIWFFIGTHGEYDRLLAMA